MHWTTTPLTGKPLPLSKIKCWQGSSRKDSGACSQLQTTDTNNSTQNWCVSHSTNTDFNKSTNEASLLIEWYQQTPARPINTFSSTSVSQPLVELCPCSPWQRCAPPGPWLWWLCAGAGGCAARAAASWSARTAAGCAGEAAGSSGCESHLRGENLQWDTQEVTELHSLLYLIADIKIIDVFPNAMDICLKWIAPLIKEKKPSHHHHKSLRAQNWDTDT